MQHRYSHTLEVLNTESAAQLFPHLNGLAPLWVAWVENYEVRNSSHLWVELVVIINYNTDLNKRTVVFIIVDQGSLLLDKTVSEVRTQVFCWGLECL